MFLSLNSENYLLACKFPLFICNQILPIFQRKAACLSLVSEMEWVEDVRMGPALYLCQKCFHGHEAMQARERKKKKVALPVW